MGGRNGWGIEGMKGIDWGEGRSGNKFKSIFLLNLSGNQAFRRKLPGTASFHKSEKSHQNFISFRIFR